MNAHPAFPTLSPATAGALADAILVLHVAVVAFVVIGLLLFLVGGWRSWSWVRLGWLRALHLALIGFIVAQSWWGAVCPLTVWEQALRTRAGQSAYGGSFIEHWLSRLIFFDAPGWVFTTAYSVFGAVVLLSWWWVRPRWSRPSK